MSVMIPDPNPPSRTELYEAVRRLDEADAALRNHIADTARDLRDEQQVALAEMEKRLNGGISSVGNAVKGVRDALTWQNRTAVASVASGVIFFAVAAAEHLFGL